MAKMQSKNLSKPDELRNFDKGKIGIDGSIRSVQINEYFSAIDRSAELNDPENHIVQPIIATKTDEYTLEHLLDNRHYKLDRLTLHGLDTSFGEQIARYKHLFVKNGRVAVTAGETTIAVTAGHSCFISAAATNYTVANHADHSEILVSY